MARMLQALKNLEARGETPAQAPVNAGRRADAPQPRQPIPAAAAAGDLASDQIVAGEIPAARVRPVRRSDAQPPKPDLPPSNVGMATPSLAEARASTAAAENPICQSEAAAKPRSLLVWDSGNAGHSVATPTAVALRVSQPPKIVRPPTATERLIRRTLTDPVRSQPLAQLAERMVRDIEQTTSKSLLLVGIGPESCTHETLLHVAPLLCDRLPGDLLLIDADSTRRKLTEALDYGQALGLCDRLGAGQSAEDQCQPTSVDRLYLLPAGQTRHADLSAAGPQLEQLLQSLARRFSCLIIDGGQTEPLAASALARLADATYFVVRLGAVETSAAQAALRDFRAAGARVLGSIAI